MGGFEGADHVNARAVPLDMAALTGHLDHLDEDHARAAALGIRTVRESIGWRLAETAPGRFDLSRAVRIAESARRHGLQVLWTLMHYGTPADVRLTDDAAIDRFAAFAVAVARTLGPLSDAPPVYNPVNEISFLAWAVAQTDMVHPYRPADGSAASGSRSSGYTVKRRLARMALSGIEAMRRVDARARFLHVEPLVHVVAPAGQPELAPLAAEIADYQWQAWDLLCGAREPELGGTPAALDLIGINHYHDSQWEAQTEERLAWHLRDPRRKPLGTLLGECWARYRRPMIVAETSHFGEGRAPWLDEIASEVARARGAGLPVHGICLYPLVDRPDWRDPAQWHDSGLWDVDQDPAATVRAGAAPPTLRRVLCPDYAEALHRWQARLPKEAGPAPSEPVKPALVVFSHLRWDFLHQRPQQLMTRLARRFRVFYVEEPLPLPPADGTAGIDAVSRGPGIDLLLPRTAVDAPGFADEQLAVLRPLLAAELRRRGADVGIAWFCTPLALPLVAELPGLRAVYDCIDEMSAFGNAPAAIEERETALLRSAALVLASGPALQRAKAAAAGRRVHCVANGVDAAAFAPDRLDAGSAQARQARLRQPGTAAGPRLGYFGAVDERLDLGLVDALADAHPDWQIIFAGPVLKIESASLPVRANLHWLGHQPWVRLPYLVAAWDVCLMPFATGGPAPWMNPVKTLEYLAAEKPVVSTRVPDVAALHPATVRIADSHAGFIAACEAALRGDSTDRLAAARETVRHAGWDAAAATIAALLDDVLDDVLDPRLAPALPQLAP